MSDLTFPVIIVNDFIFNHGWRLKFNESCPLSIWKAYRRMCILFTVVTIGRVVEESFIEYKEKQLVDAASVSKTSVVRELQCAAFCVLLPHCRAMHVLTNQEGEVTCNLISLSAMHDFVTRPVIGGNLLFKGTYNWQFLLGNTTWIASIWCLDFICQ